MSTFTPELIGRTEKTLNAILDRELAGSGVTEPQWVTLNLSVRGGELDRDELTGRIGGALHVDAAYAQELIGALADRGFVSGASTIVVTGAGHDFHARMRRTVGEITARMWGDLPADELDTAARVLATIHERAEAELAT